jgi:hypothetical protein
MYICVLWVSNSHLSTSFVAIVFLEVFGQCDILSCFFYFMVHSNEAVSQMKGKIYTYQQE